MQPQPASAADFPSILALNAASVQFLSPLSLPQLEVLHAHASYHKVVRGDDGVLAFLLALGPGAPYDSPNYRWFSQRYDAFTYIDRIVVSGAARGQGLATLLYRDLFAMASLRGEPRVVCEFDVDPPNAASEAFHRGFGFNEVGRQRVAGGRKEVSLQRAPVRRD